MVVILAVLFLLALYLPPVVPDARPNVPFRYGQALRKHKEQQRIKAPITGSGIKQKSPRRFKGTGKNDMCKIIY